MSLSFRLRASGFVLALLLLGGCAYIGEPLPPLMNIPGRGENVAAVQRGSNIIVHVTLPTLTTEGMVLKQGVRLDLRIGAKIGGPFNASADAWAARAKAAGGAVTANGIAEYKIQASEWIGHQVQIAVKIIGANGRDAGWSAPAELTVVTPPEQPRELSAVAVPQGVHLAWQGAGKTFAIFRRGADDKDFLPLGRSTQPEYIDATAEFGKPYTYVVQSLATVGEKVSDKAAEGEAQSDLSMEAAITPLDTFAAAAPVGLTAVPSTASIELVWEHSTEPNVVSYRVYRALGNGPLELLADGQLLPAYSDHKIEAGKTYRYAVSAVKSNKKESRLSEPVEVAAP
jgi:hypothetical protein